MVKEAQDQRAQAQSVEKQIKAEFEGEKLKEQLLKMSEISLWLDTYDDIFSDFDPRPYTQRSVSVDFLDEIKRASRDKASGTIELRFLAPQAIRNSEQESQIKKRLKDHFKRHADELNKDVKKTLRKGISIAALGFILMFAAVIITSFLTLDMLKVILTTLLEPSGWFMMFYGFDMAFYSARQKQPDIDFYQKMSKAEISFVNY